MTIVDKSNYEGTYDIDEIAENNLALNISSSLVISLFVIIYILYLKLFIIAWIAFIVINILAI